MSDNYGIRILEQRLDEINNILISMEARYDTDMLYENEDYLLLQQKRAEIAQVIMRFSVMRSSEPDRLKIVNFKRDGKDRQLTGLIMAHTDIGILLRDTDLNERYIRVKDIINITE